MVNVNHLFCRRSFPPLSGGRRPGGGRCLDDRRFRLSNRFRRGGPAFFVDFAIPAQLHDQRLGLGRFRRRGPGRPPAGAAGPETLIGRPVGRRRQAGDLCQQAGGQVGGSAEPREDRVRAQ
eukprot:730860-Prorocentrum_minimum.AAC.1